MDGPRSGPGLERRFALSDEYSIDNFLRLHYGPDGCYTLLPCSEILTDDIPIAIVDNRQVNTKRLLLLEKDIAPIQVIREDGKRIHTSLPWKICIYFHGIEWERSLISKRCCFKHVTR